MLPLQGNILIANLFIYFFRYFQLHGEIDDLESALSPSPNSSAARSNSNLGSATSSGHITGSGSCSAIIKVLPGNSDLLVGHDTWTSFANMLRIFKHYQLRYQVSAADASIVPGHTLTFPSYPGRLYSGDDYYLMSSGLVRVVIASKTLSFVVFATNKVLADNSSQSSANHCRFTRDTKNKFCDLAIPKKSYSIVYVLVTRKVVRLH